MTADSCRPSSPVAASPCINCCALPAETITITSPPNKTHNKFYCCVKNVKYFLRYKALVSISLAFSQKPTYTARPWIWSSASHRVPVYTQLSLVLSLWLHMEGWPAWVELGTVVYSLVQRVKRVQFNWTPFVIPLKQEAKLCCVQGFLTIEPWPLL